MEQLNDDTIQISIALLDGVSILYKTYYRRNDKKIYRNHWSSNVIISNDRH